MVKIRIAVVMKPTVDILANFSYNLSMDNINFTINKAGGTPQEIGSIVVVIFKEVEKNGLQG